MPSTIKTLVPHIIMNAANIEILMILHPDEVFKLLPLTQETVYFLFALIQWDHIFTGFNLRIFQWTGLIQIIGQFVIIIAASTTLSYSNLLRFLEFLSLVVWFSILLCYFCLSFVNITVNRVSPRHRSKILITCCSTIQIPEMIIKAVLLRKLLIVVHMCQGCIMSLHALALHKIPLAHSLVFYLLHPLLLLDLVFNLIKFTLLTKLAGHPA